MPIRLDGKVIYLQGEKRPKKVNKDVIENEGLNDETLNNDNEALDPDKVNKDVIENEGLNDETLNNDNETLDPNKEPEQNAIL